VLGLSNLVRRCHAIVFTGGSAFGLAAADGVMRWLAEHDQGFPTVHRAVPIVPAAVLYDLGFGDSKAAPTAEEGYRAAKRAARGAVAEGSVGAGTGASVAKLLGQDHALKGGVGTASLISEDGIVVGALVATNSVGSLVDPQTGRTVAGPRGRKGRFLNLAEAMANRSAADALAPGEHTTLMMVATNASLEPHQLQRVTTHVHDGFARVVVPAHTLADGDIAFAVSMGKLEIEPQQALTVGVLAARATELALLRSISAATGLAGLPSAGEWRRG
jgi:L-aminopeptidase/D-esterase-like protein